MQQPNSNTKNALAVVAALVVIVVVVGLLNMPDRRTSGEKIGDAVDALPNVGEAARQLEDRSPGEKLGDAVKDVGDDIKRNTDQ